MEKRPLPEVELVDMRQEFQETGQEQVVSRKLIEEIRCAWSGKSKRWSCSTVADIRRLCLCRTCGKTLECRNCAIALTHHKQSRNAWNAITAASWRLYRSIARSVEASTSIFWGRDRRSSKNYCTDIFPQARIARLDRDTVRSHADFERALNALNAGELDLLVGTQMIAKGHDIHGVTLVGVVGADMRAGPARFPRRRTDISVADSSRRAGRAREVPGKVILQTYFPDHYAVQYAAQHDFIGFYEKELRFRSWMHYPPYSSLGECDLAQRQTG